MSFDSRTTTEIVLVSSDAHGAWPEVPQKQPLAHKLIVSGIIILTYDLVRVLPYSKLHWVLATRTDLRDYLIHEDAVEHCPELSKTWRFSDIEIVPEPQKSLTRMTNG